jgi:uncharacterized phage protein gp47/JayE
MGMRKPKPNYSSLYTDRDKEIIEALRKRLNEKIQNDPKTCKKAAMILELWLKADKR